MTTKKKTQARTETAKTPVSFGHSMPRHCGAPTSRAEGARVLAKRWEEIREAFGLVPSDEPYAIDVIIEAIQETKFLAYAAIDNTGALTVEELGFRVLALHRRLVAALAVIDTKVEEVDQEGDEERHAAE